MLSVIRETFGLLQQAAVAVDETDWAQKLRMCAKAQIEQRAVEMEAGLGKFCGNKTPKGSLGCCEKVQLLEVEVKSRSSDQRKVQILKAGACVCSCNGRSPAGAWFASGPLSSSTT